MLKIDSPLFGILSRIFDIIFLNILWLLCSIPIITIGVSTSALYYCMLKINRGNDSSMSEMFFKSFRQNFKQGCILTIIFLFSGILLYMDFQACAVIEEFWGRVIKIIIAVLLVIWGVVVSYAFPMLAQFDNSTRNILKNSLLLGVMNIGKTIPVTLITTVPLVVFFGLPQVFLACIPLFLTFGIALISLINSKILIKVFDDYI